MELNHKGNKWFVQSGTGRSWQDQGSILNFLLGKIRYSDLTNQKNA